MNALSPTPLLVKSILYLDFLSFMERAFYELNPSKELLLSWYHEVMAAKLEDCRRGKIKRLIVTLPPRSLKSHCVSISFVAWLLGHKPSTQVVCASYGQDLSEKLARDCRTVMASGWYKALFTTRLNPARQAVNDFETIDNGFRMATSVHGPVTGRGGEFLIIDDAMKPEDALSETQRNNTKIWFDHTMRSRLNDKQNGCIIVVMQRLHQDDLVGHLMEQGGWEILSFPAIATQDESHIVESPWGRNHFQRKEGEALHPEREPLELLAEMRKYMQEYVFLSQYQQNPAPQEGFVIKKDWLKYYGPGEQPANFERIVQSWDTANKAGEVNDYSVCTTWGEKDKCYFLLHVFRRRIEFPELKRSIREQAELIKPSAILIEDKASGTQLIQDLQVENISGITPCDPGQYEKAMRLYHQSDLFEMSKVFLPKEAPWLETYIHELTTFPGSKHDDQVDSTTQALAWLRKPLPGAGWMAYFNLENEKMEAACRRTPEQLPQKPTIIELPGGGRIKY